MPLTGGPGRLAAFSMLEAAMTDHTAKPRPRNRWSLPVSAGLLCLWLLPAVAMRFTDEVDWTASDFVVWAVMLSLAGGAWELAMRASGSLAYRAGAVVAIGTGFLMVWANLAVGIIGDEDNPANLMFFGVLLVGIVGAFAARFRPRGMSRAMAAVCAAQVLASVIAFVAGWGATPVVMVVFGAAWLLSAWLFREAGRSA